MNPDTGRNTYSNTFLTIIEVKRPGSHLSTAIDQLLRYMNLVKDHRHYDPELRSHLLIGELCSTVVFANGELILVRTNESVLGPRDFLTEELGELARKHWNQN